MILRCAPYFLQSLVLLFIVSGTCLSLTEGCSCTTSLRWGRHVRRLCCTGGAATWLRRLLASIALLVISLFVLVLSTSGGNITSSVRLHTLIIRGVHIILTKGCMTRRWLRDKPRLPRVTFSRRHVLGLDCELFREKGQQVCCRVVKVQVIDVHWATNNATGARSHSYTVFRMHITFTILFARHKHSLCFVTIYRSIV